MPTKLKSSVFQCRIWYSSIWVCVRYEPIKCMYGAGIVDPPAPPHPASNHLDMSNKFNFNSIHVECFTVAIVLGRALADGRQCVCEMHTERRTTRTGSTKFCCCGRLKRKTRYVSVYHTVSTLNDGSDIRKRVFTTLYPLAKW